MSELVEWLTKVLDEDEAAARDAGETALRWTPLEYPYEGMSLHGNRAHPEAYETPETVHIGLHDPAAVLADIAAKRAIIAEYVARDADVDLMLGPDTLRQREWSGLRLAVQLMATAYADRPGYQDEWKPLSSRMHP